MSDAVNLPRQALPFKNKTLKWRKQVIDWADSKSFNNYALCRKSVVHKKINYDLLRGKLHMEDLVSTINPSGIQADYIPDKIQHYPIMISKLNVLKGEESKRVFDCRVIVTNPTAISEIEENKKNELNARIQQWVQESYQSEEEASQELERIGDYFAYSWQDMREVRANFILNHYSKQYDFKTMFNAGFTDAMAVGEEIYQCTIEGGEPVVRRLNPNNVRILKSGYENEIEKADIIILEEYWSPGRVIDTYYDVLKQKDIQYIEGLHDQVISGNTDEMGNYDPRYSMVSADLMSPDIGNDIVSEKGFFDIITDGYNTTLMPYDIAGNLRVLRVYWKSKRKIKRVKYYDENGEEQYEFYDETYIINKDRGEEETIYYINQAWEGTKIGENIYVNMRPMPVQYNSISNPSKCHFGIIGSIYNLNDGKPYSLVDMMKPFNYLYDVIQDRLNKLIARNWGTLIELDLSKKPKSWDIDKWTYFAKTVGLYITDSFNEGNKGAATGKLAGALNNASRGVIQANDANSIQMYIQLLNYIKQEMSEIAGISPQREGQISNRETVGGVERATLQSSHITEWLFVVHENLKKRVIEAFLETAKIAMKGNNKKFQYILPDGAMKIMDIDGDEFAECDYGLVVDNSEYSQKLNQQLETLAQAALQNQTLSFSTIMKLYGTASLMEKERYVERDEQQRLQQAQEQQNQQNQIAQQQLQAQQEQAQQAAQMQYQMNQENNETKVIVANINAQASMMNNQNNDDEIAQNKLEQQNQQFKDTMAFNREKLALDKHKVNEGIRLKEKALNKSTTK